jgi:hypothetical protein
MPTMNANDKIAEPRIGVCGLVRPRYTPGLMLQDDDLTQAVTYTRELNQLLFRSLLGCGVICGLVVSRDEQCGKLTITIAPGVALDGCGDPVQLCAPQSFVLDPSCKPLPDSMCIVMRGHERACLSRSPACGQAGDCASTRINQGYELRIISECPECGCGCTTRVPQPVTEVTPNIAATGKAAKKTSNAATAAAYATTAAGTGTTPTTIVDCGCVDLSDPIASACYADHYAAKCSCCTDCEWITLARVFKVQLPKATTKTWEVDHSVRRLIRPVLMRDAQAEADLKHIATGQ